MGKVWLKSTDPAKRCCGCDGKRSPCDSCCVREIPQSFQLVPFALIIGGGPYYDEPPFTIEEANEFMTDYTRECVFQVGPGQDLTNPTPYARVWNINDPRVSFLLHSYLLEAQSMTFATSSLSGQNVSPVPGTTDYGLCYLWFNLVLTKDSVVTVTTTATGTSFVNYLISSGVISITEEIPGGSGNYSFDFSVAETAAYSFQIGWWGPVNLTPASLTLTHAITSTKAISKCAIATKWSGFPFPALPCTLPPPPTP